MRQSVVKLIALVVNRAKPCDSREVKAHIKINVVTLSRSFSRYEVKAICDRKPFDRCREEWRRMYRWVIGAGWCVHSPNVPVRGAVSIANNRQSSHQASPSSNEYQSKASKSAKIGNRRVGIVIDWCNSTSHSGSVAQRPANCRRYRFGAE
jgi:hypothetical protein